MIPRPLGSQERGLIALVGLGLLATGIALLVPAIRPHALPPSVPIVLADVRVLLPTFADPVPKGPLDLNQATVDRLVLLPGIGPVLAARIVAWRESHGPFAKVEDLKQVNGIGEKTLETLRGLVTVGEDSKNPPEP
ncbi:MAG: helix-hairpin-helix domain-containing protein [Candidatus Bipolaricaulota bacterium]|nr:helix-hairpin-helix domain-containing protein [Candidatus Bipolaricaulota bacterium]